MARNESQLIGEIVAPCDDLTAAIAFFEARGFALETIFPTDDPSVAQLAGFGLRLRLDRAATCPPPTIAIVGEALPESRLGPRRLPGSRGAVRAARDSANLRLLEVRLPDADLRRGGASPGRVVAAR